MQGVPVSGALVAPHGAKTSDRRWWGRVDGAVSAVSDDQGRFRMLLTEDYLGVDVEVTAFGYAGAIVELLTPGEELHEITVPSGTAVAGRLKFAGKPCSQMPIAVVQVNRGHMVRPFVKAVLATTNADGDFRFEALPSDEPYAIFSPVALGWTGPVIVTKLFLAKEDGATRELGTLEATSGLPFGGQIRMTDGAAIPEGIRLRLGRMPAWDLIELPVDVDGRFRIENLPPDETYEVAIHGNGVVLDERRCSYQVLGVGSFGVRPCESRTDVEIPLRLLKGGEPIGPAGPLRRGPAEPTAGQQTLSGTVVDADGKPVAGIRISPSLVRGGRISPLLNVGGRLHRTRGSSGRDGRFELTNLPDEPIELMFYDQGAYGYPVGRAGKMILYPGRLRPELNQRDIRVLFDSALTTPPIDLR